MEPTAQRYRRLRDSFAAKVAAVPQERWANRSPCEDWTALDVVRHVVETQGRFEALFGRTIETGPTVDDDPHGAFIAATDQVQAHLEDPETAGAVREGRLGRTTFEEAIDRFQCLDLIVHGWDLARAAGLDEHIDPADVSWASTTAQGLGDALRTPGSFGPPIDAEPEASEQDKLLAYLGRQP